jgi:ATP-dependent Clp protease ATP-binding subunit ClpX
MREQLEYDSADIDDVLLTLDVQIEAMQNGTSCINMTEEEIVAAKEKLREDEEDKIVESLHKNEERINIDELFKKVTTTLIAQDKAARRVIAEIARKEANPSKKKDGILLTGPTGVGKTELMRLISEYIDRPFFTIDTNQITSPGYVGKDIEEYLWDLYEACGEDLEKAEHAIIFFDEIDKKGSSRKDDPSGQSVLNSLLTFIEGTTYDATPDTRLPSKKVKISTKNMTKILVGAFTDVYDHLDDKKSIGFGTDSESKKPKTEPTIDDFVKKGLMTKEYMGRVLVVKLDDLDVNSLRRILLESDKSALKIQEKIFAKIGTKITFTDGYTTKVATKALNNKTGARGLSTIVDNSTWEAFEEVYKHPGEYSEVILDEDSVEDSSHYQLVKKPIKKNISE